MARTVYIDDTGAKAELWLTVEHGERPILRIPCPDDSPLIDAAWAHLCHDTLASVMVVIGSRQFVFQMAVMSIVFDACGCTIELREWDAAGDGGGDDGEGEPAPGELVRLLKAV
jgi:hypothetical protein